MDFKIADSAAARINALRRSEGSASLVLRISVLGGGCSGFQYKLDLLDEAQAQADDHKITHNGINFYLDSRAELFISGSTLEYVEELGKSGFEIINPNATARCGCGSSFAV